MKRAALLLLAGVLVGGPPLQSQATPEAAAAAFGKAIQTNDWAGAVRLMHPDALHQMRQMMEPLLNMPEGADMRQQLFGVASAAESAATPDTVVFAHFFKAALNQEEGLTQALQSATVTPLGHIDQPGDTVLVVTRINLTVSGVPFSSFDVMPFLLYQGNYRGLFKADITNFANMLQAKLGKRS
jgi:hypothetical protein